MFCRQFIRQSLGNIRHYSIKNSALATLRKKTGFSFVNCKKALDLHNNDLVKAEKWLKEQAQALGWTKLTKIRGRTTPQGLIGILLQRNIGAMIEVNCETDFVALTEKFQQFVQLASRACLQYGNDLPEGDLISRTEFQMKSLNNLVGHDGKKLADEMALLVGSIGENVALRRAICFKVPDSIQLFGMTHPIAKTIAAEDEVQFGKYGAILCVRSPTDVTEELKIHLCSQVIGLAPLKVGNKEQDKPAADPFDETCLIYQEYLFQPSMNVGELLEENQIEIVDYQRFECGEPLKEYEDVSAATIKN